VDGPKKLKVGDRAHYPGPMMVRPVEPSWNRGFGTMELFVLSAFRIWLYLRPDIPDVDNGKEPTFRGSKYIAGETYNQSVR
jgi:hypothetical protein